jgi:uncharacterized protein
MSQQRTLSFDCLSDTCQAMLHEPTNKAADTGVLIVVGGPQTRTGSHRQFILLARTLAEAGYPCLRFDVRGMGDSSGEERDFLGLDADIEAAIAAFKLHAPQVKQVVLWGLCDGASAALLWAAHKPRTDLCGFVLANPWVHQASSHNQAIVQHYYKAQLLSAAFWRRLFSGKVALGSALREAVKRVLSLGQTKTVSLSFVDRMWAGWQLQAKPTLLLLSGNDITAAEFETVCQQGVWRDFLHAERVTVARFVEANHTFASQAWRDAVAQQTITWLQTLTKRP